jgi:predicted regulator of Ras-like GTPase activity (Roadblock/LC7/MglB family)
MQEILERILVDFLKISGVTAAGIIDMDGLIIASHSPRMNQEELEVAGGLIAQLVSAAREVSTVSGMGEVSDIISEMENGKFFILSADGVFFWFFTEPNINLGYIRVQAKKTVEKIKNSLSS